MEQHVLVIDDNKAMLESARIEWNKHHIDLYDVRTVQEAIIELPQKNYVLIAVVADHVQQHLTETLRALRDISVLPIIILTSHYISDEKIEAIHNGADLYMVIPDTIKEGVISGLALVRRYAQYGSKSEDSRSGMHLAPNILLMEHFYRVFVSGREVHLTPTEFKLLVLFMKNRRRLFSYNMLLREVWGEEYEDSSRNIVWCQVRELKKKIRPTPETPEYIFNIPGMGYRFDP